MKQEIRERKLSDVIYIADDGKEFRDIDECKKYEETALFTINKLYSKLVEKTVTEYDVSVLGCDDRMVDVVNLKNDDDIKILIERYVVENGKDYVNKYCNNLRVGKCLIGRGYGNEFWVIGMVDDIVYKIKSL